MCNHATDDAVCDNLAALAIATTNDPAFDAWVREVSLALKNKAAIVGIPLRNSYDHEMKPDLVAMLLDLEFEKELQPAQQ